MLTDCEVYHLFDYLFVISNAQNCRFGIVNDINEIVCTGEDSHWIDDVPNAAYLDDDKYILINRRCIEMSTNPHEIAHVLTHELGHLYYDHRPVDTIPVREQEAEADIYSYHLMKTAGFCPLIGAEWMKKTKMFYNNQDPDYYPWEDRYKMLVTGEFC